MGQQQTTELRDKIMNAVEQKNENVIGQLIRLVEETAGEKTQELISKANEFCNAPFLSVQPKSSQEQPATTKPPTNHSQILETEITQLTQNQHLICSTIVEIMSTKKLYLIRENFRKLVLKVLNLENAEFYVFHQGGRIQYHDFRENYITQVLEENGKRKIIQHLLANTSQAVEAVEIVAIINFNKALQKPQLSKYQKSQLFSKLFSLTPNNQTHHFQAQINKQNDKYSILSLLRFGQCADYDQKINEKIINKLIKVSMIQVEEETEYDIIQVYAKELLDVLGLIVGESEQKVKRIIKKKTQQQREQRIDATQLQEKTLSKSQNTQKLSFKQLVRQSLPASQSLIPISLKYQQFRFDLLQRIRMYSKYLCEDNVIFMDFDEQGKLYFIANNRKNSEFDQVLYQLALEGELCIEKIFQQNTALQMHVKKSLEGQVKNKKLYEVENGVKARVVLNELNQIERIIVLIEDPPVILSHSSFSSSTLQGISTTIPKKKKGSANSDSISLGKGSSKLIRSLQRQNPGITQTGWLNLFIKDHQLKRNTSTMQKKKQTLFARSQQGSYSSKHIFQPLNYEQIEQLSTMNITSPDTNLLLLNEEYLQPFVRKVFAQMRYFIQLEYNKQCFDNFLFHLRNGYQLHENSFHNFTHGVNVMHTCFLICGIQKNQNILTPMKFFSTVLSGLCHDVGHTGRTNSFQIASRSKKALTYNDLSPLENFHASYTFEILRRPENNFLQSLSLQEYNEIRKDMISNILYTDIKEHFPLIKKFKAIQYKPQEKPLSAQDIRTLTGMITHTSDFGGSAKEFEICKEWSRRVNIQFIAQYKQEEELGIMQTPFFKDLEVESIMAKNEMGFLKVIVFPLYEALDQFYRDEGTLKKLKIYAEGNIGEWEKMHNNTLKNTKIEEEKQEQEKQGHEKKVQEQVELKKNQEQDVKHDVKQEKNEA